MANRRDTFAKRQRETELKDRARAKQERRNAKRNEPRTNKGPQIAWDEMAPAVTETAPPAAGIAGGAAPGAPAGGPTAGAAADDDADDAADADAAE
ncbi:MAG TPA: hypothetical protein VNO30_13890 [Kofleriaceae bacterium]|nr:hypothetical protein [Kofleriaceae bacterium]